MKSTFFEELTQLKDSLRKYTLLYMSEFNVKPNGSGFVKCLNPEHHDNNPSMSWFKRGELLHCFSCNANLSIFDLANIFEKKPLYGKEFIVENIFYLAKKFNERYDHIKLEFSPDDQIRFRQFEIMRILYDYILKHQNDNFLKERNISKEVSLQLGVGAIDSFENLLTHYTSMGFGVEELNALGINKFFINENKLIIMIKNHRGQPVSFTAREMHFTEKNLMAYFGIPKEALEGKSSKERKDIFLGSCNDAKENKMVIDTYSIGKYMNGKDSHIFHKSEILYGYADVRKEINPFQSLIISEGYIDFISAYSAGLTNVVALGSASFTSDHLSFLETDNRFNSVAIALDADATGKKRTKDIIEEIKKTGYLKKKYLVAKYKKEGKDIDEIINDHMASNSSITIDDIFEFQTLFEYSLSNLIEEGMKEEDVLEIMLPVVYQEKSPLERSKLVKQLKKYIHTISEETILKEIDYMFNSKKQELGNMLKKKFDDFKNKALLEPDNVKTILSEMMEEINSFDEELLPKTKDLFQQTMEGIFSDEEKKNDEKRCNIKFNIPIIDQINLIPGINFIVLGKAHTSKTTFLEQIAVNSLVNNENTMVIYYTTDDPRSKIVNEIMASIGNMPRDYTANPRFHKYYGLETQFEHRAQYYNVYKQVFNFVTDLIRNKRLILLQTNELKTWAAYERAMDDLCSRDEFKNINKIAILDSVNKIEVPDIVEHNTRIEYLSEKTKKLSTRNDLFLFQNYEIQKVKKNLLVNSSNMRGSVRMDYDADVIMTVNNPMHELSGDTQTCWKLDNGVTMPVIVNIIEKSKYGGEKYKPFFQKLHGFNAKLEPVTNTEELAFYGQSWENDYTKYDKGWGK